MPICSSSFDPFTSSPRRVAANGPNDVQDGITDQSEDILESDWINTTGTSVPDCATIVTSPPMHVLSTDPIDAAHMQLPCTPDESEDQVEVICEITLSPINRNCIRKPPGISRSRKKNTLKDGAAAAKSHKRQRTCNNPHETRQHADANLAISCRNTQEKRHHMSAESVDTAQINENKLMDVMLSSETDLHIIDFPSSPPQKTLLLPRRNS
ncbi:hypothetical protein V1525DRAFT_405695 [Lipomyces kononenkoae]|uniref:Uncharacterized protein n=1 Tax=Lipomyces kononenkoae TaxID=34357 RepID=A0ACC3SZ38_LIPKO